MKASYQENIGCFAHWGLIFNTILLLLLSAHFQFLFSQELHFELISSEQGLSQNYITSIIQDQKGFIWVGTYGGLNRYDGYQFKVFRHDPFNPKSLGDNRVRAVLEDQLGRIWVGTLNGLYLFDPQTEAFEELEAGEGQFNAGVLLEDWDGSIWVGANEKSLFHIDLKDDKQASLEITQFKGKSEDDNQLLNGMGNIVQVAENTFWLDYKDWVKVREIAVNRTDNTLHFRDSLMGIPFEIQRKVQDLHYRMVVGKDNQKNVWLTVDNVFGPNILFVKFDRKQQVFSNYGFVKNENFITPKYWDWSSLSIGLNDHALLDGKSLGMNFIDVSKGEIKPFFFQETPSLRMGLISGLVDNGGAVWMGTPGLGIVKSDGKAKRFAPQINVAATKALTGLSIRTLFETSEGDLLFSLAGRDPHAWDDKENDLYEIEGIGWTVYSIFEDSNHQLWVGGGEGLHKLKKAGDGKWAVEANYPIYAKSEIGALDGSSLKACDIIEAEGGGLWVASPIELCHFAPLAEQFTHYPFHKEISYFTSEYSTLYKDESGIIWIGSPFGLYRFDPTQKKFKPFNTDPKNSKSLSYDVIKCIEPDFKQPERYLWIGTGGGGLNRFDKQTETFEHFTEKDGLPNMVIYAALFDQNGNLWMSTDKGLSVLDPDSKTFQNFDAKDGLQHNEFNSCAYQRSESGVFYFGGIQGFNAFLPEETLIANQHVPQIVITDFKISNQSVSVRDSLSPLKEAVPYAKEIILNYDQKSFSFEFSALDFTESSKNHYAVKLEGFDPDWQYIGTARTATYTNLDPGTYTFRVKGSNNDGVWNEEGTFVRVIILPPWWRTWWAYLGYMLAFGGLIYYLRTRELRERELQHQLQLEQIEAENLKEVDQLKSRFFANISHEFRTPLTLILGQLDSLMGRTKNESTKSKLDMAFRNGKRLLQLINQLLDLSKLEAGGMQLHTANKDLIPFLKNLYFSFESLAEQRQLSLVFQCSDTSLPFFFDEDKLEKVFFNLLSNAIKFTPEGGKIAMLVEKADAPFFTKITIRDTGIGIPDERLPFVFDRFFQVDSSRTREREGTGIGLALVKEFVELHGGKIQVKSQEGFGTDFVVLLPFGEKVGGEATAQYKKRTEFDALTLEAVPMTQNPQNGKNNEDNKGAAQLLIVEDNTDVRSYLHDHLLEAGYQVLEAINGEEGVAVAQEHLPDLILTDVMMPRMDGYEFSRRIRSDERSSHIPIIMLTAKAAEKDKIEGLEIGVDDYLTKPFSSKELLVRVANLIRQRQQLRERFSTATIIKPSEVSAVSIDRQFLEKVIQCIEEHIGDEQFGVESLSEAVNMSVASLNRKLNALIDQSPGNLIRSMRLQRAADLLAQNAGNVTEVAYAVGFSSPETFSRSFKKQFDCTPLEYQKKMAGEAK